MFVFNHSAIQNFAYKTHLN